MDSPSAFQSQSYVLDHLAGIHFENKKIFHPLGCIPDDFIREGPAGDGPDQADPDILGAETFDSAFGDAG
jgi:hypothetical protein